MRSLLITAVALLASSLVSAQTNPTRDTLVTGKKVDTTLIKRDKKNKMKDAVETKDHTKVTRQKTTTTDTTTTTKTKKRSIR